MDYREKFKKQERVIIVDGMIKGVVVDYYNNVGERVVVKTSNGHRWDVNAHAPVRHDETA